MNINLSKPTDYVLQAHRNSYKTTAILEVGAVWWLTFFNKEETIIFIRKSADGAADVAKVVKNLLESEKMQALYEDFFGIKNIIGKPDRDAVFNISTKSKETTETSVSFLGMGGNITGKHPSKIFADDIITVKDRVSRVERKRTADFIREMANIKTVDGNIVYTGTPWHVDDGFSLLPEAVKYPVGSIEIDGFTKEKLLEYKRNLGPSLYAANYELKHIASEDILFNDPIYCGWPANFKRCCAWLDPSYQGKDKTALSLLAETHEKTYHVRGMVWDKHVIDCYSNIVEYLKRYKCGTLYVETNADKGFSKNDLQKLYSPVIGRNESQNKHVKIVSFLKQNWDKLIFADDCQGEYMQQILDYNEGADFDDCPDSLASLIREMRIGKKSILERF